MALPSYNQQIVAQGLARLTGVYGTSPNIRAWLAAYLGELQAIEDATQGVLTMRFLSTATVWPSTPVNPGDPTSNIVFDTIGALVGQARAGLDDADYRSLIYLRVAVNRATGRTTDWANFATILLRAGAGGPISYYDGAGKGAAFFFGVWDIPYPTVDLNPNVVSAMLSVAVPNGVYGVFAFTTWADGNDFEWCDVNNESTTGEGTWGDSVVGAVGGLLVSGYAI